MIFFKRSTAKILTAGQPFEWRQNFLVGLSAAPFLINIGNLSNSFLFDLSIEMFVPGSSNIINYNSSEPFLIISSDFAS